MILLTGATGYLGSQIAQGLIERGEPFRVLVRDPARLGFDPSRAKSDVVEGDLLDGRALTRALRGTRQVIHTAALVKMWARDPGEFRRVNVEGLQALLTAAAEAGVERVIYTSSFIALGPSSDPAASEELRHHGPFSNAYEQTKAEALAWLHEEGFRRFPVTALLPGVIYGPGPHTQGNLVGQMIDDYVAGRLPGILGAGDQRWSFSFIRDVVHAHLAALEKGNREAYVLAGDNRSLNDLFRIVSEISGVHRPIRHLPFWAGKLAGGLDVLRAEVFGRAPQLTPGVVEIFKHDWIYSSDKAQRELGYHVTPLEEGIELTMKTMRALPGR